ncbi:hypothetical protein HKBW3S03_00641 [Candidatus Hakubella thermalkaliphila]|uniref:Uncharacterized protein n=1 Tax=Candidatus Hakubella thermalkaliphila TaxID=2754717 RepID=A0A6V8NGF6_9ACTN|nr:hypothetical protein HKBW3S03_00641 [Candidatus Hakubella thermalkaliphila]
MQAVNFPNPLIDEGFAIAGQIPELPDGLGRNETCLKQSIGEELGNPLAVLDISLAPGHGFNVGCIDQQYPKACLQEVKDGLPVDACTFHGYLPDPMSQKPVMKHKKIRGHDAEGADLLLHLGSFSDQDAGHHRLFVHIQACTATVHYFHFLLLSRLAPGDVLATKTLLGVLPCGATVQGTCKTSRSNYGRALGTKESRPSAWRWLKKV